MDFKNLMAKMNELSIEEGKVTVHKGTYGTSYQGDADEKEEKDDAAPRRGRGRPRQGADSTGHVPKHKLSDKTPTWLKGGDAIEPKAKTKGEKKAVTKHALKDWVDKIEKRKLMEADPNQALTIKPVPGASKLQNQAGQDIASGDAGTMNKLKTDVQSGKVKIGTGEEQVEEDEQMDADLYADVGDDQENDVARRIRRVALKFLNKSKYESAIQTVKQDPQLHKSLEQALGNADKHWRMYNIASQKLNIIPMQDNKTLDRLQAICRDNQDQAEMFVNHARKLLTTTTATDGKGIREADQPSSGMDRGAGLGAGRNPSTLEEGMQHKLKAAHHLGKSHGLSNHGYSCHFEDMEEAKMYHQGYKEGLDECYQQAPIQGFVGEEADDMARFEADDHDSTPFAEDLDRVTQSVAFESREKVSERAKWRDPDREGKTWNRDDASTKDDSRPGKVARDRKGKTGTKPGQYKDYGQDRLSNRASDGLKPGEDDTPIAGPKRNKLQEAKDATIESWDKQLNALLSEGSSVSISQGQEGMPETFVSVTATEDDADKLLSFIKQVGLGALGDEEQDSSNMSDYGGTSTAGPVQSHGDIAVVDDHDGMMSLMKTVSDGSSEEPDVEEGVVGATVGGAVGGVAGAALGPVGATVGRAAGAAIGDELGDRIGGKEVEETESSDQMAYQVADEGMDSVEDTPNGPGMNSVEQAPDEKDTGNKSKISPEQLSRVDDKMGRLSHLAKLLQDFSSEQSFAEDEQDSDEEPPDQYNLGFGEDDMDPPDQYNDEAESKTSPEHLIKLDAKVDTLRQLAGLDDKEKPADEVKEEWDDEEGYDTDDPKHSTWAERKAEQGDMERKRKREEPSQEKGTEKAVEESYANAADDTFEADIDFMTRVISGGLNKPKRDQTTLPHTAVKQVVEEKGEADPLNAWLRLSGIRQ